MFQDEATRTVNVGGEDVNIRNITLTDHHGSVKMALWQEHAYADIHPGDYITATNVIVKVYQGDRQLTTTLPTTIKVDLSPSLSPHHL